MAVLSVAGIGFGSPCSPAPFEDAVARMASTSSRACHLKISDGLCEAVVCSMHGGLICCFLLLCCFLNFLDDVYFFLQPCNEGGSCFDTHRCADFDFSHDATLAHPLVYALRSNLPALGNVMHHHLWDGTAFAV